MERIYLNNDWMFLEQYADSLLTDESEWKQAEAVRIPHTVKEVPYHYFDEKEYQMVSAYRRKIFASEDWSGHRILLTFEGIAHDSKVYVNGELAGSHHCGYTAFTIDVTDALQFGQDNEIVVRIDSRENLNIPPFGFVIDYLTYGGIYRDVYLDIRNESYLSDVFVTTEFTEGGNNSETHSRISVVNSNPDLSIRQYLRKHGEDADYQLLNGTVASISPEFVELRQDTGKVELWDVEHPNLYYIRTELVRDGEVIDVKEVRFGYRKAVFLPDGFYLNGKKLQIRGLNRHQSFAYVGYAMPKSMQKLDADILKNELGLNAVRTSHYPQSHYFLDRCDEIGLLVFTEIPGWQHIGDDSWKAQAVRNVEDMILQYRNHTSIILWGVRINESVDDDALYARTNKVAHKLDPSRQTGGVRCYRKGSLLEDVYTYNDFSHTGDNAGCEKKAAVTADKSKPYLITEYNGHMYPCKSFDWEEHRREHAIRHATVLDSVAGASGVAGSFGWCMFDYNTHKDFGSGDRICYHGVMDMFRNPKMAAHVYACQQEEIPVLAISSTMDIGEHPGSNRGDVYIFTNADSVKMYKNDIFVKEYSTEDSSFKALKHGPILIDDYIGNILEKQEKMSHSQAEAVKELLNEVSRVGLYGLSKRMYLKAFGLVARYHMKMSDAVELYNRYIGDWGNASTSYRFEAIRNGAVIKELCIRPMTSWKINATVDHTDLHEEESYDVAAVRLTAIDENGNVLPFCDDPVELSVEGPIALIGPKYVSFHGGMSGTYIKSIGKEGDAAITISSTNGNSVTIPLTVSIK